MNITKDDYDENQRIVYMRYSNAKGKCPNNAPEVGVLAQIEPVLSIFSIGEDLAKRICDKMNKNEIKTRELRETQKNALRKKYETLE